MSNGSRGEWRLMRFLGGILLGLVVCVGAILALSVTTPLRITQPAPEQPAAALPAEPGPVASISPEIAPSDPALPSPVPQPTADVSSALQGVLEPNPPADEGRFSAPEPFETTVTDNRIGGLPPDATLQGPAPLGGPPQVEDPAFQLPGPAITVNAVPFDRDRGLPLIAVVLNDAGASDLSVETLLSLSMPLTLGIAPRGDADITLAAEAKLANYEVLAQLPVAPAGGGDGAAIDIRPDMTDVEVAARVQQMMSDLWMSVGASGYSTSGEPLDERIIRGVITELERNGFAFVNTDPGTMDSGRAFAQAFSVPYAGSTARVPPGASSEEVYALLEEVAARAQAEGAVILSAPATRPVLEGLWRWGLEKGGRNVQLAPVSAVIRRLNAG